MGNTWVVDLRHYLAPTGALADMSSRALLLAEYFASIVVDATTNQVPSTIWPDKGLPSTQGKDMPSLSLCTRKCP